MEKNKNRAPTEQELINARFTRKTHNEKKHCYNTKNELPIDMKKSKYICCICGTTKSNEVTSFCVNGHDDWLEKEDSIKQYKKASRNLKISISKLSKLLK